LHLYVFLPSSKLPLRKAHFKHETGLIDMRIFDVFR
jgi:hypothetical protein